MESLECKEIFEEIKYSIEIFSPCMDDFLYVYDIQNDYYYIAEKALERFAIPSNTFHDVVKTHGTFVHPDDNELIMDDLTEVIEGKKSRHDLVYRWKGKDGSPVWINCKGRLMDMPEKGIKFLIGCINEIGRKQQADNVSGLLGERAFTLQMEQYKEGFPKGYLLRIGIDDFKIVNEKLGSVYGDYILHSVADCINNCRKKEQMAYRIVSDEFLILDTTGGTREDAVQLYCRIRHAVDDFMETVSYKAVFTISAGLIMDEDISEMDYDSLLRTSHYALSEAKARGKNQLYLFEKEDYEHFIDKRELLSALRASVAGGFEGFELYFQPIVSTKTEKICAGEALIRFKNEGRIISPMEFIPLLEESGLIIPVGKWIVQEAVKMCVRCRKYKPDFLINVNLSYIQLLKSPVFDTVKECLDHYGLDSSGIVVELTESGYVDSSPAIQNVWSKFKNEGVSVAIDDFGTGYSNLINIGDMMPHIVKIDRSFTLRALNNEYENALLRHIVDMVHNLEIEIVVEGIETQEELMRINDMHPDYIQGYFYSCPVPGAQFINLLEKECKE